jgi:hypothetical protein
MAKFDSDSETAALASETWAECSRGVPPSVSVTQELLPLLSHSEEHVRYMLLSHLAIASISTLCLQCVTSCSQ